MDLSGPVGAPRRRRRRWPGRLLLGIGVLLVAWVAVGGWYFAEQLTAGEPPLSWREEVDLTDLAVVACQNEDLRLDLVGLQAGSAADPADQSGAFATYGLDAAPTSIAETCASTTIDGTADLATPVTSEPLGGAATALVDINAFLDPDQAGLPSEQVTIGTPLGDAPAWLVPGQGAAADTWVVIVHGRGNTRAEGLRLARVLHDLGHTSLLVSYRNDGTGPATADERGRFGTTEWQDLDAAVTFARTQAPRRLALAAYSQGGAVVAAWLRSSSQVDAIDGLLLDSPLLSLRSTLDQQAANRGIPSLLARPLLMGTRAWSRVLHDFDADDVEHVEAAVDWPQVPLLLLHGDADTTVPVEGSDELAELLGDRVTYVRPRGVEHVRTANADPEGYAAAVTDWAAAVAS